MAEYKYPYIPKEYYAATMFACKMIRENGYFNKAIDTASNYYDVDPTELEKHVRARQGAGQKAKSKTSTVKYKWYAIQWEDANWGNREIVLYKATSISNAKSRLIKEKERLSNSIYSEIYVCIEKIEEFDNENDAKQQCKEWKKAIQ